MLNNYVVIVMRLQLNILLVDKQQFQNNLSYLIASTSEIVLKWAQISRISGPVLGLKSVVS